MTETLLALVPQWGALLIALVNFLACLALPLPASLFMLAAGATAAVGATGALAQVDVGSASGLRKLVPAETLEASARQQYAQVLAEARAKGALALTAGLAA